MARRGGTDRWHDHQPGEQPGGVRHLDWLCLAGLAGTVPEQLRELTNLALAGGLKRVVVLSSHGSDFEDEYSSETWQWLAFEQALRKHHAEWTCLRPAGLFASMLVGGYPITSSAWASRVGRRQPLPEFMPDVPYPFLDEDDVAAIIAGILTDGGHSEQVLDVTGTLSSARERADLITAFTGGPVQLVELPSAAQARRTWAQDGWPDTTIEVTLYAMRALAADGRAAIPVIEQQIDQARSLLGRRPRSFADWLGTHHTAFTQISGPGRGDSRPDLA